MSAIQIRVTKFRTVSHLSYCKSCRLGELAFFSWTRVRIVLIPISEDGSGFLLEAVRSLFPIPDCPRQGKLPAHPVLSHRAQSSSSQFFRLNVMRLEPQLLQLQMVFGGKVVRFEHFVELAKVSSVEEDDRLRLEHRFMLL